MKIYLLSIRNVRYVPSMTNNLIPPFIMREAGLIVNDVPRIHTKLEELVNETRCIVAKESEVSMNLNVKSVRSSKITLEIESNLTN